MGPQDLTPIQSMVLASETEPCGFQLVSCLLALESLLGILQARREAVMVFEVIFVSPVKVALLLLFKKSGLIPNVMESCDSWSHRAISARQEL